MRYIVLFDDNPKEGTAWIREAHAPAHFAYLEAHKDKIILAGGLKPSIDEFWCGGLWLLNVENESEAKALIEADPYFTLGLRRSYRILLWGKAPCYGAVML